MLFGFDIPTMSSIELGRPSKRLRRCLGLVDLKRGIPSPIILSFIRMLMRSARSLGTSTLALWSGLGLRRRLFELLKENAAWSSKSRRRMSLPSIYCKL
ncbi:hypothetical protein BDV18DRAFT_130454, partial [Aspergillus unguis]